MKELPRFLQEKINSPPAAGAGVHDWMFEVARNLHAHWPIGEIETLIRSKLTNCGRKVPDREIKAAIANSINFAWQPKPDLGYTVNAPIEPDLKQIEFEALRGRGQADLFHYSPFTFEDDYNCETVIDQLFPDNPLLCCGQTAYQFETKTREEWRGSLEQQSFIVPSPMKSLTGVTQEGKISAHCLDNTGPRRFLVVEFDFQEKDKQGNLTPYAPMLRRLFAKNLTVHDLCAALLFALNDVTPMTLAVSSGGKSTHGWWYCPGVTDEKLKPFWNHALKLGSDPKTWLKSQFIRMPDGTRDNKVRQSVLYFNHNTLPYPLKP